MIRVIRITGGRLRGRYIRTPPAKVTRPALSSVRQAVFNVLAPVLPGSRFLDLFGGSGAYAIEAISRGASLATIVEIERTAASVIRENLKSLGLDQVVQLIVTDALRAIPEFVRSGVEFDIVAVAPPHFAGLVDSAVRLIDHMPELVGQGGIVFVQHHRDEKLPEGLSNFSAGRVYRYGITQVSLLHRVEPESGNYSQGPV